ncbi:MAG: hypothetical protein VR72_01845 [Clostridiaceae bacterium BRH_c20a]|nr:MAG: hypothetical protein VR72_01845 [Clostridiaceae bacterium BRH_c20a]
MRRLVSYLKPSVLLVFVGMLGSICSDLYKGTKFISKTFGHMNILGLNETYLNIVLGHSIVGIGIGILAVLIFKERKKGVATTTAIMYTFFLWIYPRIIFSHYYKDKPIITFVEIKTSIIVFLSVLIPLAVSFLADNYFMKERKEV